MNHFRTYKRELIEELTSELIKIDLIENVLNSKNQEHIIEINLDLKKLEVLSLKTEQHGCFTISNGMNAINEHAFARLNSLRDLNLSYCKIKRIDLNTFQSLIKLETLRLEHNCIDEIADNSFQNLKSLKLLSLFSNKLKSIGIKTFKGMKSMQILYLSSNQIETIEPSAFHTTWNLQVLYLNGNNLKSLDEEIFKELDYLREIDLSMNPQLNGLCERYFINLKNLQELSLPGISDSNEINNLVAKGIKISLF